MEIPVLNSSFEFAGIISLMIYGIILGCALSISNTLQSISKELLIETSLDWIIPGNPGLNLILDEEGTSDFH